MTEDFWKSKLKAFLHDPPCKALGIGGHEEVAEQFKRSIGFDEKEAWDDEATKLCDHVAAAADRFLFPRPSVMRAQYTGLREAPFRHPFCDGLWYSGSAITRDQAEAKFQGAIGIVDQSLDWKHRFLLYWRRWPEEAAKLDSRLAFLPADTRIPDHTIWNHNGLVSAFRGCFEGGRLKPAFLLFQIGPVQSFIECAKSTRDCWSGSYILSWLISKALAAVSMEQGPDSMIFPSLRGQPFFDYAMKDIYASILLEGERTLWDAVSAGIGHKMRIPTLPNRFLMLVPSARAEEMAKLAEDAIRREWHCITEFAWRSFGALSEAGIDAWRGRWEDQVGQFLQIHWQIMDWDESLCDSGLEMLAKSVPSDDLDQRNFGMRNGEAALTNIGNSWTIQYNRTARAFAARRMLREFAQFARDDSPGMAGAPKDLLSGIEEVIGPEALWQRIRSGAAGDIFKENDGPYGAISIAKRYFPRYLREEVKLDLDFGTPDRRIASTREIAGNRKYFAVIAMDGDEIGARLSGRKGRLFKDCLADEARRYFGRISAFDGCRRGMSPAAHSQFSECLSNFALHLVEPVVQAFGGQLIYAGGDDVLAMVPAENALAAGLALRSMFRGECHSAFASSPELAMSFASPCLRDFEISSEHHGWVVAPSGRDRLSLMVPGTESDVSCGIAVAHHSFPLQRAIHEARQAEKRAKGEYGRSAFSMSLLKRSGEIIQWGGKWESPAIELFYAYLALRQKGEGNRLPYVLSQLLAPYALDRRNDAAGVSAEEIAAIIQADFRQLCARQWPGRPPLELSGRYLESLLADYGADGLRNFTRLFLSVAFIYRDQEESSSSEE